MIDGPTKIGAFDVRRFRRALLRWHRVHGRRLPWRAPGDPYRVWISEIMLQQTTVTAVVPYFERFLARFPTLAALAEADEQDVLRVWEGLGYYSRARNIHRCARTVQNDLAGEFPADVEQLQLLPGVGRYTAGAIASLAFDRPAPILEANTLRTHARLLGYRDDPRSASGQQLLWRFAERVVSEGQAADVNQALMDLGATVCRPEPLCEQCPVARCCRAFAAGLQREIPVPAKRPEITAVTEYAVAIERRKKYLLLKRPAGARWAGLWDFVRFAGDDAESNSNWLERQVQDRAGLKVVIGHPLPEIRHSVTRYRITLKCFQARYVSGTAVGEAVWVEPLRMTEHPLSKPARKLAENLLPQRGRLPFD